MNMFIQTLTAIYLNKTLRFEKPGFASLCPYPNSGSLLFSILTTIGWAIAHCVYNILVLVTTLSCILYSSCQ